MDRLTIRLNNRVRRPSPPPPLLLGDHASVVRANFWSWTPFVPPEGAKRQQTRRGALDEHRGCRACNRPA